MPHPRLIARTALVPAAALALSLALSVGCASPGPPRPPSLQLPAPVSDLTIARRGDTVVLRFTTPVRTTDGFAAPASIPAELCRAIDDGPCAPIADRPVSGPTTWTDPLPPALLAAPAHLLTYKLQLFNPAHHSDGYSDPVFAASGPAPLPVTALRVASGRQGVLLHWQPEPAFTGNVLLARTGPAAPPQKSPFPAAPRLRTKPKTSSAAPPASTTETTLLRAAPAATSPTAAGPAPDPGGSIDATALADTPYTYAALRSRTLVLRGHTLELRSESTAAVPITLHDTFAPAAPTGLTAAAFPLDDATGADAVDLIWQPNTEPDLLGYIVTRQALSAGSQPLRATERLTPNLLPQPAFHDPLVPHGSRFRYTVTAVDTHANASPPSAPADILIP